jgi:hypothetical protein
MEQNILQEVLEGKLSKSEAARKLGCSVRTIGRKLEKLVPALPKIAAETLELETETPELEEVPAPSDDTPAPSALEAKLQEMGEQLKLLQEMFSEQKAQIAAFAKPTDTNVTIFADGIEFKVVSNTFERCTSRGWETLTGSQVAMRTKKDENYSPLFYLPYKAVLGNQDFKTPTSSYRGYWRDSAESTIPGGKCYTLERPVSIGDCIYVVVDHRETNTRYDGTKITLFANVDLVTANRPKALEAMRSGKSVQTVIVG